MDSTKRLGQRLLKDKATIFGPERYNQYADPDYSVFQFPFEFTADVFKALLKLAKRKPRQKPTKPAPAPTPIPPAPKPTICDLRQRLEKKITEVKAMCLPSDEEAIAIEHLKMQYLTQIEELR